MTTIMLLILIGSAAWVLYDARSIGVRRGLVTGLANMGPWGWFAAVLGIWIVAFPLYLAKRGEFRLVAGRPELWSATNVTGPEVTLSGWAVAAFYTGLFSIFLIPAPIALVCGVVALVQIRRNPAKSGRTRAVIGIVLGGVFTLVALIAFLHGGRHS